jgi:hypothetical protein
MSKKNIYTSPIVILLTSTIKPFGASVDRIQERRQQYRDVLKFWMLHPDPRTCGIVYCDNSTPDLDWTYELANQLGCQKEFESLYCPDNYIPKGMHYGYPELGIIDYSIRSSRLLCKYTFFAKVTGRLRFPRISQLLDRLPTSYDACIDYRSAYRKERKSWSNHRARTQLMLFRRNFYINSLLQKRSIMIQNQIITIEEFIPYLLVPSDERSKNIIFRWPIECPPSGIGGNGDNFDSKKRQIKSFVSSCSRRFMPWLWL